MPWHFVDRAGFAPSGAVAKANANLAALRVLHAVRGEQRAATPGEQAVLARWASWGALANIFDDTDLQWARVRGELAGLIDGREWAAARRTTLNAHYTEPAVITAMWTAVQAAGFQGGRVLEPGCGAGSFIGLAPTGVSIEWTGVELDPVTASIAGLLYPHASIRSEGFETSPFPNDSFDLTVGNVPFGRVVLTDPVHNRDGESIHNHFIIKALRLTRPGGLVALITSRYTMDATTSRARATIAGLADLVTAVRLPSSTHRAIAGCDVVTDVLVLRRRSPDSFPHHRAGWLDTVDVDAGGVPVRVNEFFAHHDDHVLGGLATRGAYRDDDLTVTGRLDPERLTQVLVDDVHQARSGGLGWTAVPEPDRSLTPTPPRFDVSVDVARFKPGSIIGTDGGFVRVTPGGTTERFEISAGDRDELMLLVGLRDAFLDLIDAQATNGSDGDVQIAGLQGQLDVRYDSYVARFGPLGRFSWARTGRTGPDGEDLHRKMRPRMGGFRDDPDAPSVFAIEDFDPDTGTATKTAVFTERLLRPRTPVDHATDPADAIAVCLDQHGTIDVDRIATLLAIDRHTARAALDGLVFDDPATGRVETAAAYLAGDVRTRLDRARTAAARDPRFAVNVAGLEAVVPVDLTPGEIDARPGASWIDPTHVRQFITDVLGAEATVAYEPVTANWEITVPAWRRSGVTITSTFGTQRKDAITLLSAVCNNSPIQVYDEQPDGHRTLNVGATADANDKADQITARFSRWLWDDPTRTTLLVERYNQMFNAHVSRSYDGSHLTLPGLADTFTPRAHQRASVARILAEPTVLLAHEVGAGKTATMVIAAMELRRLGLARKPMVIVPNHMLEQFCTDWRALYPAARVLVPPDPETGPGGRKHFVARAAVGDWDAVVVTESVFQRIPLSPATLARYLQRQADELRDSLENFRTAVGRRSRSVKDIEKMVLTREERVKQLLAKVGSDDGVNFEQLGVDYLFIDEAHHAKNLAIATRLPGLGKTGSGYATDIEAKLDWLRDTHGPKVVTFATATPIANSLSEMYVMQRFLRPDHLHTAGVATFDGWAANFVATATKLEAAPEGGYRITTRPARFRNVPDLMRLFHQFADIRTAQHLQLPVPTLAGGKPATVVVPASPELREFMGELAARAAAVRSRRVTPDVDNMLKISSDGRAGALDMRLVGRPGDPTGGKLAAAADNIATIWQREHTTIYPAGGGRPHARPGAFQLVFADLGTPGGAGHNLYAELRRHLVARGIPEQLVRFVHEARNNREKAQLFNACRTGAVAVLIGSTDKMGVGTNVQHRCIALHHLDCPWRPADLAQRDGRQLRQGNQNPIVENYRYVTENSFDIYMWQTVERKAGFIHQTLTGDSDRTIDDIASDQELSYAEVKALATGDPRILRKAALEADVARLRRQKVAYHDDQARLQRTHRRSLDLITTLTDTIDIHTALAAQVADTRGDLFTAVVDRSRYTVRADAGAAIVERVARDIEAARRGEPAHAPLVQLGGITFGLHTGQHTQAVSIGIERTALSVVLDGAQLAGIDHSQLAQRLEHLTRAVPHELDDLHHRLTSAHAETTAAATRLGEPFADEGALTDRRAELDAINTELQETGTSTDHDAGPGRGTPCPAPG